MPLRLTRFEYERLLARRKNAVCKTASQRGDQKKTAFVNPGRRWEIELAAQLDDAGLTGYRREYRFLEDRRFRFDFAWVPLHFAVEVDGAVHRIKKRYQGDQEKGQLALLGSWRVLHVTPLQVRNGEAISLVKKLINIATAM
jgi:very-short-patch-repair endonuclease